MIFKAKYVISILLLCISLLGYTQAPFNGLIVEEVPIPPTIAASIQAEHNMDIDVLNDPSLAFSSLPRCWRVSVCFSEDSWELQAVYGYDDGSVVAPFELNSGSGFYQHFLGSGLRNENPVLSAAFPNYSYDSWFTIGPDLAPVGLNELWGSGSADPISTQFEENNSGFLVNDSDGGSFFNTTLPPGSGGEPQATGETLIAQFTSDEIITGTLNFQFRALDPVTGEIFFDGSGDVVVIEARGIPLDLTPGALPDACSIQFLPVEWLDFQADVDDASVDLSWKTASELNNDYFVIQRSSNLTHWEDLFQMNGAGTTTNVHSYYSKDNQPLDGVSYYRIKQVDYDGQIDYSEIRSVLFQGDRTANVWPNPAHSKVEISSNQQLKTLNVISSVGKVVFSEAYPSSRTSLDINRYPSGVYTVEIVYFDGYSERKKLVIK